MPEQSQLPSIAWLVNQNEGFGIQRAVTALASAARRAGCRTSVFALAEGGMSRACREAGLEVEVIAANAAADFRGSMWRKPSQLFQNWRSARRLAADLSVRVRRDRFEVLHWLLPNLVPLGGRAAAQAGALAVWEMPNEVSKRYPLGLNRRLYQILCRRYGIAVIANSQYTARSLAGGGVTPTVIYPATDSARFDPRRGDLVAREALGLPQDAPVFGIFGRIVPDKGAAELIEALATLPDAQGAHVLLIGGPNPGPFVTELQWLAGRLRFEDRMTILPAVPDIERYYGVVDVAVNARTIAEPFGLSVAEAMLMGKPVLAHALGGPAETVVDGVTGWHYHAPEMEALRAGVIRALAERGRWEEMGRAARERALELFDSNRLCERYLRLIIESRVRDRSARSRG